jgi:hypothetical protein
LGQLRAVSGVRGRGDAESALTRRRGDAETGAHQNAHWDAAALWSEPVVASELQVMDQGGQLGAVTSERRRELRAQFAAGQLEELTFEASTFRAVYPNANYLRFRDEDLAGFAASFAGQPFLRNHDLWDIESRGGTVLGSELSGRMFVQRVKLTVPRDIQAFLNGQIDRFSIAWNRTGMTCSLCGLDWLNGGCPHWPGRKYKKGGPAPAGGAAATAGVEVLCELIVEGPTGREVSAVNAPAVGGTGVRSVLDALCAQKLEAMGGRIVDGVDEVDEVVEVATGWAGLAAGLAVAVDPAGDAAAVAELLEAQRQAVMDARLGGSGLPASLQGLVRQAVRPAWRVSELDQVIDQARAAWAKLEADSTVKGVGRAADGGRIGGMTDGMDQIRGATEWLFGVGSAKVPAPSLRRIDNLYQALTGDWEWRGVFDQGQSQLEQANSTSLADLATNAMNKVIIEQFAALAVYRWFEQLVTVQPNDGSTQNMAWISYGGTGDLPVVAEGAAYTEGNVADTKETSSFIKRGKYVGITLEMIRRSDIARIQAVPKALALDAIRTRSAAIAGLFTVNTGVGPTLADDSLSLFNVSHGANVQTTAFDVAGWKAARSECAKMVELGSARRLGLFPEFCLVPIDLYDAALVVFGYGSGPGGYPGTPNNDVNPYGDTRPGGDLRPVAVKVPDWTDVNDWAYLVDPKIFPVIQMSYAQSPGGGRHPAPELFSVASPTSGLMFTNDVLPVKVRDWFAYGVSTWRGIGKRNVAG